MRVTFSMFSEEEIRMGMRPKRNVRSSSTRCDSLQMISTVSIAGTSI